MTFTHALSTNNYGPAKFIVTSSAANGTHTTIASALTAATSGDTIFIRPGTYTENLTLKAGVNLSAYTSDCSLNATGTVIISGTCTLTAAGSVTISGIQLQTNSAALLAVTGSSASIVNLTNCYLNCSNNTGITFSAASTSAKINCFNCQGNLGTTGIGYYTHTSTGGIVFNNCYFTNTGGSSTANTCASGTVAYFYCAVTNPTTTSSTGGINIAWSNIDTSTQNVTALTLNASGTQFAHNSIVQSGSATAITVTSGTFQISNTLVTSSNGTAAISGAGTLNYHNVTFGSSAINITTTTTTGFNAAVGPISFDKGVTYLSSYLTGTFVPTVRGTGTAGTGTYTNQVGRYTRIGNRVFYQIYVVWTNLTGGTGNLAVDGLPFTPANNSNAFNPCSVWCDNLAYGLVQFTAYVNPNSTALTLNVVNTAAAAAGFAIDTAGGIMLSGHYEV